jgi:hypothetical protein
MTKQSGGNFTGRRHQRGKKLQMGGFLGGLFGGGGGGGSKGSNTTTNNTGSNVNLTNDHGRRNYRHRNQTRNYYVILMVIIIRHRHNQLGEKTKNNLQEARRRIFRKTFGVRWRR